MCQEKGLDGADDNKENLLNRLVTARLTQPRRKFCPLLEEYLSLRLKDAESDDGVGSSGSAAASQSHVAE